MSRAIILAFLVLAFLVPSVALSQARDTARFEPIVTSATRAPLRRAAVPASVTVLRGEDLRLRGITTVAEALNTLPGAYLAQTGSQGGTTSLFLRGGESKYVKVLIDGVPANDPGGVYDFASLTTDNVDRIEIVRGPVSVIHGADAATGVVQVFTRRGEGAQRVETEVRFGVGPRTERAGQTAPGSVQTLDAGTSISGALPSGSYSVALARHTSAGLYQLNNGYLNNVLSGRFEFAADEGTEVRLALRYNDYRYNYPTTSAGDIADSNAFRSEDRTAIGVEIERDLGGTSRILFAVRSSVNDGGTDDGPDAAGSSYISQDKIRRRSLELRYQLEPARHLTMTWSAQLEQQDQRSQDQSQSSFGPFYSVFSASRRNLGVAGEATYVPDERLTATIGVRVEDNERFGTFTTKRAGVSMLAMPHTRLRATVGTAFREPSFFENYATGFVTGNPGLKPEETRSVEVGVEQGLAGDRATLSLVAFAQRFDNMIDYSGGGACGFSYCNVTEVEANGLELEARGGVWGPLSASLGGTLLQTGVLTAGYDASPGGQYRTGEALIRRPAVKWSGEVTWKDERPFAASVRVLATGARGDRDFHFPATPVTLDAYQRVDVGASWDIARRHALTLRVENVLDEEYQSVFNFLAPRRTITLGTRVSF